MNPTRFIESLRKILDFASKSISNDPRFKNLQFLIHEIYLTDSLQNESITQNENIINTNLRKLNPHQRALFIDRIKQKILKDN